MYDIKKIFVSRWHIPTQDDQNEPLSNLDTPAPCNIKHANISEFWRGVNDFWDPTH